MQSKNRVVKGSKVPSINLSKEILSLLIRLEDSELKEVMVGIRDYVYKDKEPSVSEDVDDIMEMVLDNVNYIASKHLNGKKGGKPKKTNTESQPDTEVKKEAQMSPNEPDLTINDTEIPQGGENVSEAPKQGEFDHSIEEFETNTIENENMGTLIGYIPNFNVETRAEKSEFNVLKFIDHLKENNGCLYTKLMRTPSRGLSLDANITRMKECLDMLIQDFIPDSTKRQQLYLYVIENQ
jgi:hypothetical protein